MIDTRHGYGVGRKIGERFYIATDLRTFSVVVLLNANLEAVSRRKIELEKAGETGLVLVKIENGKITEIEDPRASVRAEAKEPQP